MDIGETRRLRYRFNSPLVGTGGYCSVVDSKPGANSGLRIIGDKGGYDGLYAAKRALKGIPEDQCNGRFQ